MNPNPHKFRCTWCDFKQAIKHWAQWKPARRTAAVHVGYYTYSMWESLGHFGHFFAAGACCAVLVAELLHDMRTDK